MWLFFPKENGFHILLLPENTLIPLIPKYTLICRALYIWQFVYNYILPCAFMNLYFCLASCSTFVCWFPWPNTHGCPFYYQGPLGFTDFQDILQWLLGLLSSAHLYFFGLSPFASCIFCQSFCISLAFWNSFCTLLPVASLFYCCRNCNIIVIVEQDLHFMSILFSSFLLILEGKS